jgi:hypothetical protein
MEFIFTVLRGTVETDNNLLSGGDAKGIYETESF